jgi:hypothetical protein
MSFSVPSSTTARCCRSLLRSSSKTASSSRCIRLSSSSACVNSRRKEQRRHLSRRWASTDASTTAAPTNSKISGIVDQISRLTLLETADLVASLKVGLLNSPNLPATPWILMKHCIMIEPLHDSPILFSSIYPPPYSLFTNLPSLPVPPQHPRNVLRRTQFWWRCRRCRRRTR